MPLKGADKSATLTTITSPWAAFLRLWFVLLFSFAGVKVVFNLIVMGWLDLRPIAFLELLLLPLGQSVVFWSVTRRRRGGAPEQGGGGAPSPTR